MLKLKIKSRIALLYSVLTVILIIFFIVLFYLFLKLNLNKEPLISNLSLNASTSKITVSKKGKAVGTDSDSVIIIGKKPQAVVESKSDKATKAEDSIMSFTEKGFEKIIMSNLYSRFFIIIAMVIAIILLVNFLLSKRYASFALEPLIQFTKKVEKQRNFNKIELIEAPVVKDEIYDLTLAYNEALGKIKGSYENLQRLNSYVSHELRNSLAVLRAKVEIGEDTEEITGYIDGLNNIISDILAMATTTISDRKEEVDLALICAKLIDEYSVIFNNFNFDMPEEGVETIKGKEVWIERCVANLIDNSMKFMDKEKAINEINIKVYEDDNNVTVEVYDNGKGIEKDRFEKIFIPYYGTEKRTSTGIGLAYIKHVMDLHEGKILVESSKGEYSKFSLVFKK
ncbi:sensor histidine kinase [Clostridium manihotivorum]|uniref:histidine kinase n=1 Tax=Clostridium manihotivorum TaxID=2320868 RepID=A0A3R5TFN9_9CLOT|nr:HAMP domain-containing sensor histidine kinase [Clostridium manihotivorum]QAA32314.1 sensor histidine kinase [Clostridium manihotivorum]